MNEVDSQFSSTTLYNTVVTIGADGAVPNRHRKLMPTNPERMVWGFGDATGLRVVETPLGRIGALICWESYMPLARFALYAQNIDIYEAPTWDNGETWLASMNHIAREGGCWVLCTATALETADIPEDFPERERLFAEGEWINPGGAVVVKPFGGVVAGPLRRTKRILYADIDVEAARAARRGPSTWPATTGGRTYSGWMSIASRSLLHFSTMANCPRERDDGPAAARQDIPQAQGSRGGSPRGRSVTKLGVSKMFDCVLVRNALTPLQWNISSEPTLTFQLASRAMILHVTACRAAGF